MAREQLRIIGLTDERSADVKRNAGLFEALAGDHEIVDLLGPHQTRGQRARSVVRHFHPSRTAWRHRATLNAATFAQRSRHLEHELARRREEYDLVLQLQTLFFPVLSPPPPHVVYTDNTYSLTARHFPQWSRLRPRQGEQMLRLEREAFGRADAVLTKSEFCRRAVIEDYGVEAGRVHAVGAGANLPLCDLTHKDWGSRLALFVGYDWVRKGGEVLLAAWPEVRRRVPGARLVVVGPRRRNRPTDGVEWLGRVDDRRHLAALYRAASLFVMPSLFEPWGLTFAEAMAHGLPCVGSDGGAMPEVIEPGLTGSLVPSGDADALAEAMAALLLDPERAETMGRRGHELVRERHAWSRVAERAAPVLGAVAGARATARR